MENAMKKRYIIPTAAMLAMVLLNVIARFSTAFSDFYVTNIFPAITNALSFVSGLLPFSLGEILIILGIILVIIGVPLTVILLIFRKNSRRKTLGIAACAVLWVMCYITVTETMNCFIMYQCTPFSERYFDSAQHTEEELTQLYAMLIDDANDLAKQVPRDKDNRFYLTADASAEAAKAMKAAAEDYPQLKGYYPKAKQIRFSYFMSQSNLLGIYFPFTLEANYNGDMVETNLPSTLCHEYAHLKGVIQEDEASFISYIATQKSSNAEFRYSGTLDALEYVHNQIYESNITQAYYLTENISEEVTNDWFRFLPDDYWKVNAEKEVLPTESVSSASETFIDTNIKMNGRKDGIKSYSHIVNLLLDYYFGQN